MRDSCLTNLSPNDQNVLMLHNWGSSPTNCNINFTLWIFISPGLSGGSKMNRFLGLLRNRYNTVQRLCTSQNDWSLCGDGGFSIADSGLLQESIDLLTNNLIEEGIGQVRV